MPALLDYVLVEFSLFSRHRRIGHARGKDKSRLRARFAVVFLLLLGQVIPVQTINRCPAASSGHGAAGLK